MEFGEMSGVLRHVAAVLTHGAVKSNLRRFLRNPPPESKQQVEKSPEAPVRPPLPRPKRALPASRRDFMGGRSVHANPQDAMHVTSVLHGLSSSLGPSARMRNEYFLPETKPLKVTELRVWESVECPTMSRSWGQS